MQQFTESFGFVIAFLFGVALFQAFLGEKAAMSFLALVLFGMLITNANKFSSFLSSLQKGA